MKPSTFVLSIGAIAACTGLYMFRHRQHTPVVTRTYISETRYLGEPRTFRNLTLVSVYDTTAKPMDTYTTLDEGLKSRTVKVQESPQGGDVNTLYLTNKGTKPLYAMAGEVVLGGQQDRCLGKDIIVAPGKLRVPISVFCVEHGRWTGQVDFDSSAKTVASTEIRSDAQEGAFVANPPVAVDGPTTSNTETNGRSTALGGIQNNHATYSSDAVEARISEAQGKVWEKVASKNASFNASPDTGTYRQVLNMSGGDAQKSIAPYVKALFGVMDNNPQLVGMVAAVNGKVIASDTFSDPILFQKLWPKLLNSYAADAAERQAGGPSHITAITQRQAVIFVEDNLKNASKAESKSDSGVAERYESENSVTYRLVPHDTGFTSAGSKAAVHDNVLSKGK